MQAPKPSQALERSEEGYGCPPEGDPSPTEPSHACVHDRPQVAQLSQAAATSAQAMYREASALAVPFNAMAPTTAAAAAAQGGDAPDAAAVITAGGGGGTAASAVGRGGKGEGGGGGGLGEGELPVAAAGGRAAAAAAGGIAVALGAAAAPPPAWARAAQQAAAQVLALAYEWGVWDLLGTITAARQVLGTVLQLPGVT